MLQVIFVNFYSFKGDIKRRKFIYISTPCLIVNDVSGTSSRDSLLSWIRFLQRDNPDLENIPILFTLQSPLGSVVPLSDNESDGGSLTKT